MLITVSKNDENVENFLTYPQESGFWAFLEY